MNRFMAKKEKEPGQCLTSSHDHFMIDTLHESSFTFNLWQGIDLFSLAIFTDSTYELYSVDSMGLAGVGNIQGISGD